MIFVPVMTVNIYQFLQRIIRYGNLTSENANYSLAITMVEILRSNSVFNIFTLKPHDERSFTLSFAKRFLHTNRMLPSC